MHAHFDRVQPIVGPSLRRARVALTGLPAAAPLVAHLAACGVGRWLWADPGDDSPTALRAYLLAQHGPALALDAPALPPQAWTAATRHTPPDLIIAVGGETETQRALKVATATQTPALLITPPSPTRPCQATSLFPPIPLHSAPGTHLPSHRDTGTVWQAVPGIVSNPTLLRSGDYRTQSPISLRSAPGTIVSNPPPSPWDWLTAAPFCAGLARAMLLRDTPYRRADLEELWGAGVQVLTLGRGGDPLAVSWSSLDRYEKQDSAPSFRAPMARRGKLLIAGLGSLGSVAALHLAPHAAGMLIADPDRVDVYNPVRQAFPLAVVGRPKAQALREGLLAAGAENVAALDVALTDEREVAALIARQGITAALVATGTAADFAIARALRACDMPHVVGRCYPRARYWEAMLVDGLRGPALGDLRGHLRLGPAPPPTPEQIAAYSDAGALEAEPATLIESGWAAAWMARLTAQLLAPPGLRERWLLALLASEQTCVIGGVGVEHTDDGPAFGVALPGEIRAWGRDEIGY